jgi:Zn-dependent protease
MGIPFGRAKPVPINPLRFDRKYSMRTGMMVSAAAGPVSNVLMAVAATVVYGVLFRFAPETVARGSSMAHLLVILIEINVVLALFNMLPVFPLDGSRVADGLMPERFRPLWDSLNRFAPFLLIAVFFYGGSLISGPRNFLIGLLSRLLVAITS